MTPTEYLTAEFRRYYRDAARITVSFTDERIDCEIIGPIDEHDGMPAYIDNWMMSIGSDDDWYSFDNGDDLTLTIPLMDETP